MSDLISRADLFNKLATAQDKADCFSVIQGMETIDAEPVRHGHWIIHVDELFPADSTQECSVCHGEERLSIKHENYCPNCGAKMDEVSE